MCGVIGLKLPQFDEHYKRQILTNLLIASQIRGQHATGIATLIDGKIKALIQSIPAKEFVESKKYNEFELGDCIIGHTRYSTSDIRFNMPIYDEEFALVHNGVITQSSPDVWFNVYQYKTQNDSEILFHALKNHELDRIKTAYPDMTYSYVTIDNDGNLEYAHNGKRPLYDWTMGDLVIVASTKSTFERSKVSELLNFNVEPNLVAFEEDSTFIPQNITSGIVYKSVTDNLKYFHDRLSFA